LGVKLQLLFRTSDPAQTMDYIAFLPTASVVTLATITDLRSRRIPNLLVLPFLVAGLLVSGYLHGWPGLGQSLLGVLAGAGVMGVFCFLGGMGLGDLKLCAAVGAWIGPSQLFIALVITGLVGGVMALCWAVAGGFLTETLRGAGDLLLGFRKRGFRAHETLVLDNPVTHKMPYAPAIAVGVLCSFLNGK
jgi:prepilin peptidase CpaA